MPVSRHCLFEDRNAQVQAATVTPISMATPMIEAATTKALKSSGMQHLRIAQVVVKEDRVSDGSKEEQAPDAFATGSSKTIDEIVFGGQKGPRTKLKQNEDRYRHNKWDPKPEYSQRSIPNHPIVTRRL